jgi:hypothetical protein
LEHLKAVTQMIDTAEARWLVSCAHIALPPCALRKINQRRQKREKQRRIARVLTADLHQGARR